MLSPICPNCGKPKPTGSPDGKCPTCLLSLALGLAPGPPRDDAPGASNASIENNVIYGCTKGWPISLGYGHITGLRIFNNTMADMNPYRDGQISIYALTLADAAIENNIFYLPSRVVISI